MIVGVARRRRPAAHTTPTVVETDKEYRDMRLFIWPKLTDEEHQRCLLYQEKQLRVAAFLDREGCRFAGTRNEHWPAITQSPRAAGEICRAADRFRQAAEETVRRHAEIQPVPAGASRFYEAESFYFSYVVAWAKANLAIMETLAAGRPPCYVGFDRLKAEAEAAWQQANAAYRSFRRRIGLTNDDPDALETALQTHDFMEAGIDDWQPEPYTRDFGEAQKRIIAPQEDGPDATADTMTHNPTDDTNPFLNIDIHARPKVPPVDPQDPTAWFDEGCGLAASNRHEEAAACYDKILKLDLRDAAAWFNKGVSLAALDRREEAMLCYDKVIEIDPQDWTAWFNKGVNLAALEQREEAVGCFDRALAIDPQDETVWCAKGVNLAALDRRDEALGCWDRALQIDTHCVAAWCAKGVTLANSERHQEAISCFDEALKIDPGLAPVWSNKGDCLAALGRHEEAIVCCDKALELDPQDDAAWYNKAVGLAALARHEEAVLCFDKALGIAPTLAAAWSKKGNSLAVLHRPEEAITCYARAVRIDPRDAVAWYNKALREEACGHKADAVSSYQQFLEVAPPERAELVATAKKKLAALHGKAGG